MNCKRYLIVKIGKIKRHLLNTSFSYKIKDLKEYFEDNGFWYGIKIWLFPPLSTEKFIKKMIDFELRHYKGINYDYLKSLPLRPEAPHQKLDQPKNEFDAEYWRYIINIYYMLDNIYNNRYQEFQNNWTDRYKFKSVKEYIQFEKYYYKLYPKTKSWHVNKSEIENSFSWFNLQYGLSYDFKYEEIKQYKNKHK